MLSKWTEILPLFVVRWLAVRLCERGFVFREGNNRIVAFARPDVMFKIKTLKENADSTSS